MSGENSSVMLVTSFDGRRSLRKVRLRHTFQHPDDDDVYRFATLRSPDPKLALRDRWHLNLQVRIDLVMDWEFAHLARHGAEFLVLNRSHRGNGINR